MHVHCYGSGDIASSARCRILRQPLHRREGIPTSVVGEREQLMFTRRFTFFVSVAAALLFGALEAPAQIEIVVRGGGSGSCGGTDPNTLVISSSDATPQPALIAGGNVAPECACGAPGNQDPNLLPLTTHNTGDTWGDFTTTFVLPLGATSPAMTLSVRADDGAQVFLNGTLLQTIDYYVAGMPTTHVIQDNNSGHFLNGLNSLRFYVPNTQSGHYGGATPRGGPGDCMHVQYEARVTYVPQPVPTLSEWGLIALTLLGLVAGTLMFARWRVAEA